MVSMVSVSVPIVKTGKVAIQTTYTTKPKINCDVFIMLNKGNS